MTSGIQLEGYPESCCIHCRRTSVRRGPMPSVDAPGRTRPMMRNQAETDCRNSALSPSMTGSC